MTSRVRRVAGIIRREVGADVLLFDPRDDSLHVLNTTAAFVWEQLEDSRSVAQLEQAMRGAFAVPSGHDVSQDLVRVVDDLRHRRLIDLVAEPS